MNRYTFTITRDVTESAVVSIEAENLEEAHMEALCKTPSLEWELDEMSYDDPYLPDPDDYSIEAVGGGAGEALQRDLHVDFLYNATKQVCTAGVPADEWQRRFFLGLSDEAALLAFHDKGSIDIPKETTPDCITVLEVEG
jgi:hypothetical protein